MQQFQGETNFVLFCGQELRGLVNDNFCLIKRRREMWILVLLVIVIHRLHDFDVGRHRHRHFEMSAKPTPTPTSNRHHKMLVYFAYF